MTFRYLTPAERLVRHVQHLEQLEAMKKLAAENLQEAFKGAKADGYDTVTLKVVLKLRKMTPEQRQERRALEAIYMSALGMLEGDSLPEAARRKLDEERQGDPPASDPDGTDKANEAEPKLPGVEPPAPPQPEQPPLIVKDPAEARQEGSVAAEAGKRIYDNPYPAGDPCRAAWDEGWCAHKKSHGMETPAAYQRRPTKSPDPGPDDAEKKSDDGDDKKGGE